jgi:PncC family amidohydrolase
MDKGLTIATAEECTCGLIGAAIASNIYAQRWYKGSFVTFDYETAMKVLDIPQYTIIRNDFVSLQVASTMALNTIKKLGVMGCISVVGYVEGVGSENVPNGDVQICVGNMIGGKTSFKYKKVKVKEDRGKNIEKCIEEALKLAIELITEE